MFSLLASLDKSLLKDVSIGQRCGSIRVFLGLPDLHPDPLVTRTDPARNPESLHHQAKIAGKTLISTHL